MFKIPISLRLTDEDRRRLPPLLVFTINECDAVAEGRRGRVTATADNEAARAWAENLLYRLRGDDE